MNYKASITGFRIPPKHDKLTPEDFLHLYVTSLKEKRYKANGREYVRLAQFIIENWDTQVKFVTRLFYVAPIKEIHINAVPLPKNVWRRSRERLNRQLRKDRPRNTEVSKAVQSGTQSNLW